MKHTLITIYENINFSIYIILYYILFKRVNNLNPNIGKIKLSICRVYPSYMKIKRNEIISLIEIIIL